MLLRIFILFGLTTSLTASLSQNVQYFCRGHSPQQGLDIKLLMGRWYIVEVIHHMINERLRPIPFINLEACPTVHIIQQNHSNMKLFWNEQTLSVYYIIKVVDNGSWVASGPHNETIIEHSMQYLQYTGQIEVMKAVSSHIVLTFCKSDHVDSQLFSVILARDPGIDRAEIFGVKSMLQRRGLTSHLVKKTCSASTTHYIATSMILLTTCVIKLLF